jgi:hypothetical protein
LEFELYYLELFIPSFSISQMEIMGKNLEKSTNASTNPAQRPAIIDHSIHKDIYEMELLPVKQNHLRRIDRAL